MIWGVFNDGCGVPMSLMILHHVIFFGAPCSWMVVLGSKVDKLSKILIKTSNATKCIESNIKKIEVSIIDDPII